MLVCAFDFSVVIFQYCTSGFSSGQGPGGLARLAKNAVLKNMHRKTAL